MSRGEVADYIADTLKEMLLLAYRNDMQDLAYQIGVALEQAKEDKARQD